MTEKIDIVVLWVDGSDPEFIREKQAVTGQIAEIDQEIDGEQRYRDYGIFNYWFRMIEKHAPWVNHIYLVTNGQKPEWLNLEHPQLKLVTHKEFIPKEYLPTYNSAAIELNLHRIEGLSENFLYFNDDHNNVELIYRHFPNKKALKSSPWKFFNYRYRSLILKNLLLLPWGPTGYVNQHLPVPMKKSTLAHLWEIEGEILDRTSRNKIRNYGVDVNQYICSLWQIESNQFYPMSKNFGETIGLNQVDKLDKIFEDKHKKLLCVNDDSDLKEENLIHFKEIIQERYPKKSAFEK